MRIFNDFNDMFNSTCHFPQLHIGKIFDTAIYNGVADISAFLDIMNGGTSTQYLTDECKGNDRSIYEIDDLVIEHKNRIILKQVEEVANEQNKIFEEEFKILQGCVNKLSQKLAKKKMLKTGSMKFASLEEISDFLLEVKPAVEFISNKTNQNNNQSSDNLNKNICDLFDVCCDTFNRIHETKEETWYEVVNIYKKDKDGKPLHRDPWRFFYEKIMNITDPKEFTKIILTACRETPIVTKDQIDREAVSRIKRKEEQEKGSKDNKNTPSEGEIDNLIDKAVEYAKWLRPMANCLEGHKFQWTPNTRWFRDNTPKEVEDCVNAIFGNTLAKAALHYMPRGYKDKYDCAKEITKRFRQNTNAERNIYGKLDANSDIVYWEFKCNIKNAESVFFSLHLKMFSDEELKEYHRMKKGTKAKIDQAKRKVSKVIAKINKDIKHNKYNKTSYKNNNLGKLNLLLDAVDNNKYIKINIDDKYNKELEQ